MKRRTACNQAERMFRAIATHLLAVGANNMYGGNCGQAILVTTPPSLASHLAQPEP